MYSFNAPSELPVLAKFCRMYASALSHWLLPRPTPSIANCTIPDGVVPNRPQGAEVESPYPNEPLDAWLKTSQRWFQFRTTGLTVAPNDPPGMMAIAPHCAAELSGSSLQL